MSSLGRRKTLSLVSSQRQFGARTGAAGEMCGSPVAILLIRQVAYTGDHDLSGGVEDLR
jgi:hypothetical protein